MLSEGGREGEGSGDVVLHAALNMEKSVIASDSILKCDVRELVSLLDMLLTAQS